jgi:hypothetical protein
MSGIRKRDLSADQGVDPFGNPSRARTSYANAEMQRRVFLDLEVWLGGILEQNIAFD